MASLYLARLTPQQKNELITRLHEAQNGNCFICEKPIDLAVQANTIDIDHVIPLKASGPDDPTNFALTHASCNRSKQASDLRVARVLARFDRIRVECAKEERGPNLSDVLHVYGGAKHELRFAVQDGTVRYALGDIGDNQLQTVPVYEDKLSHLRYFFVKLPIAYLHHDDRINPRDIGSSLGGLVEEFHRQFPQLHVALGWVSTALPSSAVRV